MNADQARKLADSVADDRRFKSLVELIGLHINEAASKGEYACFLPAGVPSSEHALRAKLHFLGAGFTWTEVLYTDPSKSTLVSWHHKKG